MGEKVNETLKLQFDKRLRLEFHGAKVTSDAGLLACRELDGVAGIDGASTDLSARDPRWQECAA
ncbi:MAG: transposase [Dehalococcoidia bacterium]|nr:transposase [Dehalococcoidia bacterium]